MMACHPGWSLGVASSSDLVSSPAYTSASVRLISPGMCARAGFPLLSQRGFFKQWQRARGAG